MNDDGTYSVGNKDNIRQQWIITYVPDYQTFLRIIPENRNRC